MSKIIVIPNALTHILLHGYFEHGFEVFLGNTELVAENSNNGELLSLKQTIGNIRARLRGDTYLIPNLVSGLSSMLNIKEAVYPLEVKLSPNEEAIFDLLIQIPFARTKKYYKKYMKSEGFLLPSKIFYELLSALRTNQAIEFLRKKFIKQHYAKRKKQK